MKRFIKIGKEPFIVASRDRRDTLNLESALELYFDVRERHFTIAVFRRDEKCDSGTMSRLNAHR